MRLDPDENPSADPGERPSVREFLHFRDPNWVANRAAHQPRAALGRPTEQGSGSLQRSIVLFCASYVLQQTLQYTPTAYPDKAGANFTQSADHYHFSAPNDPGLPRRRHHFAESLGYPLFVLLKQFTCNSLADTYRAATKLRVG